MALTKITTSVVAVNSLTAANIADNSIDATKIANNQILARHIAAGSLSDQLAANSITAAMIPAGSLSDQLAAAQPTITSLGTLTSLNTSGSVTMDASAASGSFLTDATIYPLRLTNDNTTAGNAVALSFGQGGFDFTNFIASVRTGTGSDPKGDLVFGGRPSDGSSFLERMRIDSSGNVGIGRTSISQPSSGATTLAIQGTDNNKAGAIRLYSANDSVAAYIYPDSASGLSINTSTSHPIVFRTAGSERMRIDSSGNVGIGTTSPSNNNAQLVSFKDGGSFAYLGHNNTGGTFPKVSALSFGSTAVAFTHTTNGGTNALTGSAHIAAIQSASSGAPTDMAFYTTSGGVVAEKMRIDSSGNIGISGTTYQGQTQYGAVTFPRGQIFYSNTNAQNQLYLASNAYTNSSGVFAYKNTGTALALGLDNGAIGFYTAASGSADATISWNNYMNIANDGNLAIEQGGAINFESANNDYTTVYTATGYTSQSYSDINQRYWHHLHSKGGTHITINTDGGHTQAENNFDDFVIWQGTQDIAEPLFRVSNAGRVIAKRNYEIGNHKTNKEEFGVSAVNGSVDDATNNINTTTDSYEKRSGVYWLHYNSKKFRAFVRPDWMQGRNWVLAAKFFAYNDMPSGSTLWTNDTSWNGGDFDLNNGHFSKYGNVWRYFSFNRLAMQMGNRVAPIMQFTSNQTLYGAFSGGRASNGGGITADSTDPSLGTGTTVTYHSMTNYMGPNFTDLGGAEDRLGSYGLNKWAASSTNSTSGNNNGSANLNSNTSKGFQFTVEDNHPHIAAVDSIGYAGAWIGCPMDEGASTQTADSSNSGGDSGFGLGGGCGNTARTWTSGVAEWARGNEVANYLPAYIWLSID